MVMMMMMMMMMIDVCTMRIASLSLLHYPYLYISISIVHTQSSHTYNISVVVTLLLTNKKNMTNHFLHAFIVSPTHSIHLLYQSPMYMVIHLSSLNPSMYIIYLNTPYLQEQCVHIVRTAEARVLCVHYVRSNLNHNILVLYIFHTLHYWLCGARYSSSFYRVT